MHYVEIGETGISQELIRLPTLVLFRMGYDTHWIASAKQKPEATIYNWLHDAKEQERLQIEALKQINGDQSLTV